MLQDLLTYLNKQHILILLPDSMYFISCFKLLKNVVAVNIFYKFNNYKFF